MPYFVEYKPKRKRECTDIYTARLNQVTIITATNTIFVKGIIRLGRKKAGRHHRITSGGSAFYFSV